MLTIFVRTVIIYFILVIIMRLMGKRQLGELELSELIVTFLLSEIASNPITDKDAKMLPTIIPLVTLALLEIGTSYIMLKFPAAKRLLSSSPSVVIAKGVIDIKAMKKARISIDELLCQIRQNGIFDLEEVDYAILEENGKMSIIPKSINRQPDRHDLNIQCKDSGVMHVLISDKRPNAHTLKIIGKDEDWLKRKISKMGLSFSDIFCMTIDDAGKIFIQKNDETQIIR